MHIKKEKSLGGGQERPVPLGTEELQLSSASILGTREELSLVLRRLWRKLI